MVAGLIIQLNFQHFTGHPFNKIVLFDNHTQFRRNVEMITIKHNLSLEMQNIKNIQIIQRVDSIRGAHHQHWHHHHEHLVVVVHSKLAAALANAQRAHSVVFDGNAARHATLSLSTTKKVTHKPSNRI